jgi:hypothetical protein
VKQAIKHQATCVAIDGRAVLIEGPPGAGKSSLALALIDRGAALVVDDGVTLERDGARLLANPVPETAGLIEVRGLGLVTMPTAHGVPVALVIALGCDGPRFIEDAKVVTRHGALIPQVQLWPDSPVLHLRAELALRTFGLVD